MYLSCARTYIHFFSVLYSSSCPLQSESELQCQGKHLPSPAKLHLQHHRHPDRMLCTAAGSSHAVCLSVTEALLILSFACSMCSFLTKRSKGLLAMRASSTAESTVPLKKAQGDADVEVLGSSAATSALSWGSDSESGIPALAALDPGLPQVAELECGKGLCSTLWAVQPAEFKEASGPLCRPAACTIASTSNNAAEARKAWPRLVPADFKYCFVCQSAVELRGAKTYNSTPTMPPSEIPGNVNSATSSGSRCSVPFRVRSSTVRMMKACTPIANFCRNAFRHESTTVKGSEISNPIPRSIADVSLKARTPEDAQQAMSAPRDALNAACAASPTAKRARNEETPYRSTSEKLFTGTICHVHYLGGPS